MSLGSRPFNAQRRRYLLAGAGAATLAVPGLSRSAGTIALSCYYPIAVGGPITKIIDRMVDEFQQEHPDISVKSVYSGNYAQTLLKTLTAAKSGQAPNITISLPNYFYTMIDEDVILPYDDVISGDEEDQWLHGFFPAYLKNNGPSGKIFGIPFQRSTPVMYWNKQAFEAAGLDPDHPPQNWDDMVEMGKALTKRDGAGNVTQWGWGIPATASAEWIFQCFTTPNGVRVLNDAGTETYLDDPKVIEAMQFWTDLGRKHEVVPPGVIEWGTTPRDFLEGRFAIMWTTSGNLTSVRESATFPFGVAMIPERVQRGTPTGGANLYLLKGQSEAEQRAALTFVKWLSAPERAAQWCIDTGYVAPSPAAWETDLMKAYAEKFPEVTVARDQLQYATGTWSTHENEHTQQILKDAIQGSLTGAKTVPDAMREAQSRCDRVLRRYR